MILCKPSHKKDKSDIKLPMNEINNYFSIGIDAKISYDFHHARGINYFY